MARTTCFVALALVIAGCGDPDTSPAPERIVLINVDTLRRDHVSAYASPVRSDPSKTRPGRALARTPNIDRLAEGGQVFTHAVSSFHATTMSVAALFTGLTPSIESGENGESIQWNTFVACGLSRHLHESEADTCVPRSVETLAEDLRSAGYWTLAVVSNQLLYRPNGYDRGFDRWVEVGLPAPGDHPKIREVSSVRTARHVNRDALEALSQRPSDEFFLYVHYLDVHDYALFGRSYADAVELLDRFVGEFLDALNAEGLLDDTTIILTSDHGEILKESFPAYTARHFGNPSFQPVLEIPLLVHPATSRDPHAMIRSQDLRGLIRELVGLDELAQFAEGELREDEHFISEMKYRTYRRGRWKTSWPRTGDAPLLFDLQSDPSEKTNLAARPSEEHREILSSHRLRIDELSERLATRNERVQTLDAGDLLGLQALGYIETTEESFGEPASPTPSDE